MSGTQTLAERVAAALRHAIFQEAYLAGDRLVELTIAHDMNVSQNTARDALRLLEQEGLVVKRARYGTHVCDYAPEEAAEIYALWAAVEKLALRWVLANICPEQIAQLRESWSILHPHYVMRRAFRATRVFRGIRFYPFAPARPIRKGTGISYLASITMPGPIRTPMGV